jgi:uncharacterized protein (TIGR00255 family)
MAKSMTGFGRAEASDGRRSIAVEIKAVNHRFSDISVKMPRRYSFSEETVKALVKVYAPRGKVDVSINVSTADEGDTSINLNLPLAKQYYDRLTELKNGLPGIGGDVTLQLISGMPDVLKGEPEIADEDVFLATLSEAVKAAGENLLKMKETEGEKLIADILAHGAVIEHTVDEISVFAPQVVEKYKNKMTERIQELLGGDAAIPEERILTEAAIFADRSDITEEMTRLRSHISQLRKITSDHSQPIGKTLDFLAQEMNREANTIGSKANDINITNKVLILKTEIEKIREQIQNIE